MTTPRTQLDKLLDAARNGKDAYAEVELANGAKLAIGAVFVYHLRFSCVSGEQDLTDIDYSAAYDLLNASNDGAEHLASTIAELRGLPLNALPPTPVRPQPSAEALAFAATFDVGWAPREPRS